MRSLTPVIPFMLMMAFVIAASNFLVQFPVHGTIGGINLADILTWGAFTYPVAFLITDLTNRRFGARSARYVAAAGFVIAVFLSFQLATPRIAIASGAAFLAAQLLDVRIFDKLRHRAWWMPPFISTLIGSCLDTLIFFGLAFSQAANFIGAGDAFATEPAAILGVFAMTAPRWISWALGDLSVKLIVGLAMLAPYGALLPALTARPATRPQA